MRTFSGKWVLGTVVFTGACVYFEPAPYDLLICAAMVYGLLVCRPTLLGANAGVLLAWLGFAIANVVSLFMPSDADGPLRFFAITIYLMVSWLFVKSMLLRHGMPLLRSLLHAYVASATAAAAIGVLAYVGLVPGGELMLPGGRLQGLFKDPNVYGPYLVPAAVLALGRLTMHGEKRKLLWLVVGLTCGLAVFLSFSRGAVVNLGVAVAFFYGVRAMQTRRVANTIMTMTALVLVAIVLGVAVFAILQVPAVSEMFSIRWTSQSYDTLRVQNQMAALELALQHPAGIGPGMTEPTFGVAAHNMYIRALTENGIVGLVSLAALLLGCTVRGLRRTFSAKSPEAALLLGVCTASLVAMLVESVVIDTVHWRHFWLFAAFVWTPDRWRMLEQAPPRIDRQQ